MMTKYGWWGIVFEIEARTRGENALKPQKQRTGEGKAKPMMEERDSKGRIIPHSFFEAWQIMAVWEWLLLPIVTVPSIILRTTYPLFGLILYIVIVLPVWRWKTRRPQEKAI